MYICVCQKYIVFYTENCVCFLSFAVNPGVMGDFQNKQKSAEIIKFEKCKNFPHFLRMIISVAFTMLIIALITQILNELQW